MHEQEVSLERVRRALQNAGTARPLGIAEQKRIDVDFLSVMIGIFRGEKMFFTEMHNSWSATRDRMRGLLLVFILISIGICFSSPFGIILLIITVSLRIWYYIIHGDRSSRRIRHTSSYKKTSLNKNVIYDMDMAIFDLIKEQLTQEQKDVSGGGYALVPFEDIYQNVRHSIEHAKDRLDGLLKIKWVPIWPSGDFLPHFSSNEVDAHSIYLQNIERYLDDYQSIRFPNLPKYSFQSENDKEEYD